MQHLPALTLNSIAKQAKPSLGERAILDLIKKDLIYPEDIAISPLHLQHRYDLAEKIGIEQISLSEQEIQHLQTHFPHFSLPTYQKEEEKAQFHVPLKEIDYVVVLSGRSGFYGEYEEAQDKVQLCPDHYDTTDTLRRLLYAILVAKQATLNHFKQGIFKLVPIYFNGSTSQNNALKNIIRTQESFDQYLLKHGYAEEHFFPIQAMIIDAAPLDNTMGQTIGFSYYLHHHWSVKDRHPNVVFVSSTYHVARVEGNIGNQSPLHTAVFFKNHPHILKKLSPNLQDYVLSEQSTLKHARIMVLGCDRQYSAVYAWEKDLYADMQAFVSYASLHKKNKIEPSKPSITATLSSNIITHACIL